MRSKLLNLCAAIISSSYTKEKEKRNEKPYLPLLTGCIIIPIVVALPFLIEVINKIIQRRNTSKNSLNELMISLNEYCELCPISSDAEREIKAYIKTVTKLNCLDSKEVYIWNKKYFRLLEKHGILYIYNAYISKTEAKKTLMSSLDRMHQKGKISASEEEVISKLVGEINTYKEFNKMMFVARGYGLRVMIHAANFVVFEKIEVRDC